jgi:methanethiol S-methyltransferase
MIAWINFSVLLLSSILFLFFYIRSVSPAGREKVIGSQAYQLCYYDRLISGAFELIITTTFILYHFFPLPVLLPPYYPWPWWVSALIAALIGVPAVLLMTIGLRDAGEEALRPKQEHRMYAGIYNRLRHPQTVGEVFLFPVMALLLHSPFLTLFSLIYFPIFILLCYAEEQDLLLRYGDAYARYSQLVGPFWPRKSGRAEEKSAAKSRKLQKSILRRINPYWRSVVC